MDHRRRGCRGNRTLPTRLKKRGTPACLLYNATPGGRETPLAAPLPTPTPRAPWDHAEARNEVGTPLWGLAGSGRPIALTFQTISEEKALCAPALPLPRPSFSVALHPHPPGPLPPSVLLTLQLYHPLNPQAPRTKYPLGRHPRSTPTVSSDCPFGDTPQLTRAQLSSCTRISCDGPGGARLPSTQPQDCSRGLRTASPRRVLGAHRPVGPLASKLSSS